MACYLLILCYSMLLIQTDRQEELVDKSYVNFVTLLSIHDDDVDGVAVNDEDEEF